MGMPNGCMLAFWIVCEVEFGGVDIARGLGFRGAYCVFFDV